MSHRAAAPDVRISRLETRVDGRQHRVSAEVDGVSVWFDSLDLPLRASGEAFGSAFLIPALIARRRIVIEAPVCPIWLTHQAGLVELFHRWWRLPRLAPQASPATVARVRSAKTGLCFSGGVDSFHTLLRGGRPVDWLVTAQGFDMSWQDSVRIAGVRRSLEAIASRTGARPVVVRTNLRDHPLVSRAEWERAHGGALASLGHLLDESLGTLLVSSSIQIGSHTEAWGSHWRSDPLWSSSRLQVIHCGAEVRRRQKLEAIAGEELVQQHLRVCWENLAPQGNCSRCEKCVVTMLILSELGLLNRFAVFEHDDALAARVDALPRMRQRRRSFFEASRSTLLAPEIQRAVRELVERTRSAESLTDRARRLAGRMLARVRGRAS